MDISLPQYASNYDGYLLMKFTSCADFQNDFLDGKLFFNTSDYFSSYTMAFLARQLSLRCPELGSPTIIMIVDREELQKQGAKLFTKSKEFLNLGEVSVVPSRKILREELGTRESGGFYICTIQKFVDRP